MAAGECLVPPRAVSEAKRAAASGNVTSAIADLLRCASVSVAGADACDAAPLVASLLDRLRKDPYACLGLPRPAEDAAVKAAYRSLSLSFHPDKCGGFDSTALFQAVAIAHERLKTPTARKEWDEEVREAKREAKAAAKAREAPGAKVEDIERSEAAKKRAEEEKWNKMVASKITSFVSADRGKARAVENADRAERNRRASNVAAMKRRADADHAATKKTRDSHRAWLKSERLKREQSLERAA